MRGDRGLQSKLQQITRSKSADHHVIFDETQKLFEADRSIYTASIMESICDRDIHIFHISCQLQPCEVIFDETQKNYLKLTDRSRPVWTWKLLRLIDLYSISPVNSKLLKFTNSLPRTYMKYLQIETFTCPLPTTVGFVLFRCGLSLHQLAVTRIQKTLRNPNLLRTKSSKLGLCTLLRTCPNLNHPYNFLSAYDVLLFMLRQCKEKACRLSEKGAR